jgi:hypothetical protein
MADKLYDKIFDILLVLRDTRERFSTYSATDIKKLIAAKMKAVRSGPADLQLLYQLGDMIAELQASFELASPSLGTV